MKFFKVVAVSLILLGFINSCKQKKFSPSYTDLYNIYDKKYDSLRTPLLDALSKGIQNVNDFEHFYTKRQINILDSVINNYKRRSNFSIAIITYDSGMVNKDSVTDVTSIVGIKYRIRTTIGISFNLKTMSIWNDSLINNTALSEYETKQFIDSVFIPDFKKGDFFDGTLAGLNKIISKIQNNSILTKKAY